MEYTGEVQRVDRGDVYPSGEVVLLNRPGRKATAKNLRTGAEEVYE